MAIIKNRLFRLRRYPFRAIDEQALTLLCTAAADVREAEGAHPMGAVHVLECVCDLAGERFTLSTLLSSEAQRLYDLFCSAIHSQSFAELKKAKRLAFCRSLRETLNSARILEADRPPIIWDHSRYPEYAPQWENLNSVLDPMKVAYWSGWPIENRDGETKYLPLEKLWNSHGEKYTEGFHLGISTRMEGATGAPNFMFGVMLDFLDKNQKQWPSDTFHDPLRIHDFFAAMMEHYFLGISEDDPVLPSMKKSWNRFIGQVYSSFIDSRIWCTPYLQLSLTDARAIQGSTTHVKKNRQGITVRTKLVTHIPIYITEQEAVEKLIFTIKDEIQTIRSWATQQTLEITQRFKNGKKLAASGKWLNTACDNFYDDNFINNMAAAFEKYFYLLPVSNLRLSYTRRSGENISTPEISRALGIPTTRDLYPFQCLLILEHPFITNHFLENFNLCNKNGKQTGVIAEGGKTYLVVGSESTLISGLKRRKGVKRGRQKVELSETAASILSDVITITQPARDYLRSIGDENARKLFIASPYCVNKPIPAGIPRWNKTTLNYPSSLALLQQFHPHTKLRGEALKEFLSRISPSTIRASRCVEEYLITGSTALMSECLGHEEEDSILLETYLPEIFVQFIEGRGIRVMHKAMICHALRNSPFLVAGANFDSMEILGEFLNNYAIKELPGFLRDPEGELQTLDDTEAEVLVKMGVGSLTALISLEQAVRNVKDRRLVKESAKYWARLTPLIVKDIEEGTDGLLKEHLKTARVFADPHRMEKIIYAEPE
ncbi:hypothetical protein [Pseudomonas fluorescens group sp. PF-69]